MPFPVMTRIDEHDESAEGDEDMDSAGEKPPTH